MQCHVMSSGLPTCEASEALSLPVGVGCAVWCGPDYQIDMMDVRVKA